MSGTLSSSRQSYSFLKGNTRKPGKMSFFLNAVYKHDFVWGFVSLLLHTGVIFRSIFCQAGEYILQSFGKKGGIFLLRKLEQLYLNSSIINVRNNFSNGKFISKFYYIMFTVYAHCVNSAMNSSKILPGLN